MKFLSVLLFVGLSASSASAQNSTPGQDCPDVLIQDYAWGAPRRNISKEDPRFKADSSGRPINSKDNPINTVGNPVNMIGIPVDTVPVRPQGGPPPSQITLPGNPEMVQSVEVRREAYLLVKNSGSKVIKAINWDYVFFKDPSLAQELSRRTFHSKKKIAPGEAKFISESVFKRAPSKYQKVFISRVDFADGSTWQRP